MKRDRIALLHLSYVNMGMSASEIVPPLLGALQASISVLLTISYGVIAAQFKLLSSNTAKEVSRTCVRMFLPALLITQIGAELHQDTGIRYVPILIWAVIYNVLSILLGYITTRMFKLPTWVTPALAFNNTTSMPLLLFSSLASTGILSTVLNGPDDTSSAAIARAKSYFLVNSMVSNSLTFAVGPRLLRPYEEDAPDKEDKEDDNQANRHLNRTDSAPQEEDVEDQSHDQRHQADHEESQTREEAMQLFIDEETSLLPQVLIQRSNNASMVGYTRAKSVWNRLPRWAQATLDFLYAFVNPPLIGAVLGALIGLVPALHRLFFNDTNEGGYLNAWLQESINNIGSLFASLQIIVVGVKLSQSLQNMKRGEESGTVPWDSMLFIIFIRFILWPAISIPVIWAVVTKTNLIGADPILWLSMMLMPTGPPAMILTSLADVNGSGEAEKMSIAKFLTVSICPRLMCLSLIKVQISYAVTPLICFSVVGALKASESALPAE